MMINLPYGNEIAKMKVPDQCFIGMINPPRTQPAECPEQRIQYAIEHPTDGRGLEGIISSNRKITVIVDDGSRPTPISIILSVLVEKLTDCRTRPEHIKIMITLGSHRYVTEEEMRERVGDAIYDTYPVMNSEFRDPERLVHVGDTEEGAPLMATSAIMDAQTHIGAGNFVPHPVVDQGGGGKITFPGVVGEDTVSYFHLKTSLCDGNMFDRSAAPVRDMTEGWVRCIGLDFVINTILTPELRLCRVVAGDYIKAHREGVRIGRTILGDEVTEKADVVIVSPHPMDRDFWQSPKTMYETGPALKEDRGGTIIMISSNHEGIGPRSEYPEYASRGDRDDIVRACIAGEEIPGDRLAIAVRNSMSKMRRRRKLVVTGGGTTAEQMAQCGCKYYPLSALQQAVDDTVAKYEDCRVATMSDGVDAFLYGW